MDNNVQSQSGQAFSGSGEHFNYSIDYAVSWLLRHNLSPLPIAPKQDPFRFYKVVKGTNGGGDYCPLDKLKPCPLLTGKNPSDLDKSGTPHLVRHTQYNTRHPNASELKEWFTNPLNGVATLGTESVTWIDIDATKFKSLSECQNEFDKLLEREPKLKEAPIKKTQGGGYRIGIKPKNKLGYTNFSLYPNGGHVGELLGPGRVAVLAPTVGPSGGLYEVIQHSDTFPVIDCEGLFFPYENNKATAVEALPKAQSTPLFSQSSVNLSDCLSPTAIDIYKGITVGGDRSELLTTLAKECYGWENWLA